MGPRGGGGRVRVACRVPGVSCVVAWGAGPRRAGEREENQREREKLAVRCAPRVCVASAERSSPRGERRSFLTARPSAGAAWRPADRTPRGQPARRGGPSLENARHPRGGRARPACAATRLASLGRAHARAMAAPFGTRAARRGREPGGAGGAAPAVRSRSRVVCGLRAERLRPGSGETPARARTRFLRDERIICMILAIRPGSKSTSCRRA